MNGCVRSDNSFVMTEFAGSLALHQDLVFVLLPFPGNDCFLHGDRYDRTGSVLWEKLGLWRVKRVRSCVRSQVSARARGMQKYMCKRRLGAKEIFLLMRDLIFT